ncbi:MAG: phosphoenolpyruvate--protein phosphotransferase [Clostridia bacterium]|nr:phosphoenolpyruvate--protein phosphotransferase [Clostridia bacterium]
MLRFKGKGVYGAIAIGRASLLVKKSDEPSKRVNIESVEGELLRVTNARKKAHSQLDEIYKKAILEVGETGAQIFEIHKMMLDDEDYLESVESIIKNQGVNAEYAVSVASKTFSSMFENMEDAYMQARAADIKDISSRLISCLSENEFTEVSLKESSIICASDLAPSETVALDKSLICGIATVYGSVNSHTSILARNMNIPAIIGLGEEFLNAVHNGDTVAINGYTGEIFINPDKETVTSFERLIKDDKEKKLLLETLRGKENITLDGRKVNLYANIGGVENLGAVLINDADGIGLFRSEFIYLESDSYPTEQKQVEIYKSVLEAMGGKKVIIRTLDIGADKQVDYFSLEAEENPALGYRAIRICLDRTDIFKTQLRALFRASIYGNLSIMFPMVTSVWEVEGILEICEEIKKELDREEIKYAKKIEMGIMIETPAAAIISDSLAPLVDFFSIGTNDLIQYTLACDRQNPRLDKYANPHHEAVLRLIKYTVDSAHKYGKWVGICGELASDLSLTEEFLKMGIDELSVSPSFVLPLRKKIRETDLTK